MRESPALAAPASPVWDRVRAAGYLVDQDHPLVDALAAAHQRVHGVPPRRVVMGSAVARGGPR